MANIFQRIINTITGRGKQSPTLPEIKVPEFIFERPKPESRPEPKNNYDKAREVIEQDEIAQEIGIDDDWINNHVHIDSPPPIEDIVYISGGFMTFSAVEKRVIGSGIESYMHIWYDRRRKMWYYGVECISPPC